MCYLVPLGRGLKSSRLNYKRNIIRSKDTSEEASHQLQYDCKRQWDQHLLALSTQELRKFSGHMLWAQLEPNFLKKSQRQPHIHKLPWDNWYLWRWRSNMFHEGLMVCGMLQHPYSMFYELYMTSVTRSSFVHKAELYANAVLSDSPHREEGMAALATLWRRKIIIRIAVRWPRAWHRPSGKSMCKLIALCIPTLLSCNTLIQVQSLLLLSCDPH